MSGGLARSASFRCCDEGARNCARQGSPPAGAPAVTLGGAWPRFRASSAQRGVAAYQRCGRRTGGPRSRAARRLRRGGRLLEKLAEAAHPGLGPARRRGSSALAVAGQAGLDHAQLGGGFGVVGACSRSSQKQRILGSGQRGVAAYQRCGRRTGGPRSRTARRRLRRGGACSRTSRKWRSTSWSRASAATRLVSACGRRTGGPRSRVARRRLRRGGACSRTSRKWRSASWSRPSAATRLVSACGRRTGGPRSRAARRRLRRGGAPARGPRGSGAARPGRGPACARRARGRTGR
jgi:hypothetical protein